MVRPGPARGPGRAGPENPGPRALRAETGRIGPNDFLFKIFLCIVRWPLGSKTEIIYCCNLCNVYEKHGRSYIEPREARASPNFK